jgi:hypothetical protein
LHRESPLAGKPFAKFVETYEGEPNAFMVLYSTKLPVINLRRRNKNAPVRDEVPVEERAPEDVDRPAQTERDGYVDARGSYKNYRGKNYPRNRDRNNNKLMGDYEGAGNARSRNQAGPKQSRKNGQYQTAY